MTVTLPSQAEATCEKLLPSKPLRGGGVSIRVCECVLASTPREQKGSFACVGESIGTQEFLALVRVRVNWSKPTPVQR
jgi:hypothetical protein